MTTMATRAMWRMRMRMRMRRGLGVDVVPAVSSSTGASVVGDSSAALSMPVSMAIATRLRATHPRNMPQLARTNAATVWFSSAPFSSSSSSSSSSPLPPAGSTDNPLHLVVREPKVGFASYVLRFLIIAGAVVYVISESPLKEQNSTLSYSFSATTTPPSIRFSDVKGCDEAIEEMREVVEFLRNPSHYNRLGAKMPRGVLLVGPPGTGKTLLAKAVAGEANVPFFACSASEFEEMYVGVGARRIRALFKQARQSAPSIIFIDEIDAVGSKRRPNGFSGERMTINQLLVELDGFNESSGVIVMAATNFPESLDSALTRPGRFDRHVVVPLPDITGRKKLLDLYGKRVKLEPGLDLGLLARGTPGCSGADLAEIMNSAALRAASNRQKFISMKDLEYAKDKVQMGAERKSARMTPEVRRLTAYHEGGHALVALLTKGAHPLHKLTIVPRGFALGMTHMLPEDDMESMTREQLLAQLDVCMGGRVAEELLLGADFVTTGASNDLEKATKICRQMIASYGMGDASTVGLTTLSKEELQHASDRTKVAVDKQIREMLQESYARAKSLLVKHREDLDVLSEVLLDRETLDRDEIRAILEHRPLPAMNLS